MSPVSRVFKNSYHCLRSSVDVKGVIWQRHPLLQKLSMLPRYFEGSEHIVMGS